MKNKQLLILLGIFVVLLVVVFISKNPFSKYEKTAESGSLFPNFNKDNIAKIETIKSENKTVLIKNAGKWLVKTMDNYPADQEEVEKLIDKVAEFETSQLISKNPEKQSIFEVDNSGLEAKLYNSSGELLADFFVGKNGPDFMSTYVRKADSDKVYLVDGYLKSIFDKGERTWKDRSIFDFNKEDITQLTIVSENQKIVIPKDEEGNWKIIEPEAADAKKDEVDKIADKFSTLEASDFAEEKELKEYGFDEPKSKLSAMLSDGSVKTLLVGNKQDSKYYVKTDDKETIYILYKYIIDDLFKKFEDLKQKTKEQEKPEEK